MAPAHLGPGTMPALPQPKLADRSQGRKGKRKGEQVKTSPKRVLILTLAWCAICFLFAVWMAFAQDGKPKSYTPTELQSLKLQNFQKDAIIAKQRMQALEQAFQQSQKDFQTSVKALTDEAEAVKKQNSWPETTQFNPDDLKFSEPAKDKK